MQCKVSVYLYLQNNNYDLKAKRFKTVMTMKDNLETKKSKNYDNKDNEKKDIEDNNNTSSGQYTFDSSDPKEIMTGIGGGEDDKNTYPDSDKYIVEDIKKAIKKEKSEFGEEESFSKKIQNNQIIKMNEVVVELFILP